MSKDHHYLVMNSTRYQDEEIKVMEGSVGVGITEPWVEAVCQYFDSAKNRISPGHVWSMWEDKVLEVTKCPHKASIKIIQTDVYRRYKA